MLAQVVLDKARGAGWVEQDLEGEVGGGLGGGDRVEGEAGLGREGFSGAAQGWGARRQNLQERLGQSEGLGGERLEDGGDGLVLLGEGDDLGVDLIVAAKLVTVVEAADDLNGGFGLVSVEEVERDERVLKLGHGHARPDGVLTEAGEGGGADGEDAVELVGGVGAVVPEVRVRLRGAERAGVLVGDVDDAGFLAGGKDLVQLDFLVRARGKLAVTVIDGGLVPEADADGIGVGEVGNAVLAECDVRVRVIHDGDGLVRVGVGVARGGEIVGEAEGVAGLMRGELAEALQDHGEHGVVRWRDGPALDVGTEQRLGDEVILAAAEGAESDIALHDLAGAWVGDGGAVAPAAGVAMYPLDHVIADVHGVGVGGEDVDLEGAFGPAGGLESLVPPACAFEQGGADGLGRAIIDVVLDGRFGLAGGAAGGVFLVEAVADDELLVELGAERGGVVAVGSREVAGAGVVAAWDEAGAGKLEEGLVLVEGEGVWVGGDVGDEARAAAASGGGLCCKGEEGLDFGVLGKGFGSGQVDGGAGGVEPIGALLEAGEGFDNAVRVAEEEVGGVDENGAGGVGRLDLEAGEYGLRERLADGEDLGGVGAGAAEVLVGFDEQDLGTGALEADDAAFGGLAAVEAEVV